ncbi:hypothetical protein KC339_g44 [Hortaea werneckii]|nr:hypothetical protein KC339_g44 [Hortaea werneckii]
MCILSSILERPKLGVAAPLEPDIVEPGLTAILALSSGFSLRSVGYLHQKLSSDPGVKWMKRLAIHARCCACYLGHSRSTQVLEQVRSSNSNALLLDWDDLSQREQMSLFVAVSAVSQCEGAAASDRKAALRIVKARSRQSWTRTVWCASQQPGAPSRSVRHMRKRMQHARFVRRFLLGCAWPSTIVRSILPRTVRTCTVALICPFILLQLAPFHLGPFIIRSVPCASNSKADLLCRLLRLRPLLLCQLLLVELDLLLVPGDGGGLLDIELSVVRFLPLCSRVSWPCEKFFFSLVALLVLGSSVTVIFRLITGLSLRSLLSSRLPGSLISVAVAVVGTHHVRYVRDPSSPGCVRCCGGLGVRREGGGRRHGGASFPSVGVVGWLVGGLEQRSSRVLAGMGGGQRSGRAGEDETLDGGVGGWVHGYSMDGMAGLVGQTTSFSTLQAE